MPQTLLLTVREEWTGAWESVAFRRKFLSGLFCVFASLSTLPIFFQHIEKRSGVLLNDPIMKILPVHNVSLAIFIFIWSITLLMVLRAAQNPQLFLIYVWSYFLLLIMRVLTIALVPLDPPAGLVPLVDPVSNFFYGEKFVTRDLFFSGHTSAVFLMFLCLKNKTDKLMGLLATIVVGFLLMVQHVHYSMDVFGALVFAWIARAITLRTILKDDDGRKDMEELAG